MLKGETSETGRCATDAKTVINTSASDAEALNDDICCLVGWLISAISNCAKNKSEYTKLWIPKFVVCLSSFVTQQIVQR